MDRVQSMFGSNVFHTPAGELVEKATSSSLTVEDWSLNMEVCDKINSYSDGARDAVKAIKKRLSGNKNYVNLSITLSLLQSCVKNCGTQFHILIATREFCNETLMKIIQPKYNPPIVLQRKVLGIIKQWAEAFGSDPLTNGVKQVYDELKEKGFDFPQTSSLKDIMSTTVTKTHSHSKSQARMTSQNGREPAPPVHSNFGHVVNPNAEQLAKLRKDLAIVNGNAKVFSEMLTELNPLQCDSSDYELMQELNRTCRAMQQRIVELIGQIGNEEVTIELLRVNDDLNNVFLRYERFEKFRSNKDSVKKSPNPSNGTPHETSLQSSMGIVEPPPSYSDTIQPTPEVNDLIDLSGDSPAVATSNPPNLNVASLSKELGDINLNSRSGVSAAPASYPFLSEQLSMFDKPQPEEVAQLGSSEREIEQWLASDGNALDLKPSQEVQVAQDVGVTDEFSAFLSERASASKHLPDASTA